MKYFSLLLLFMVSMFSSNVAIAVNSGNQSVENVELSPKQEKKLNKFIDKIKEKSETNEDLRRLGIIIGACGLAALIIGAILGIGIFWQLGGLALVLGIVLFLIDYLG